MDMKIEVPIGLTREGIPAQVDTLLAGSPLAEHEMYRDVITQMLTALVGDTLDRMSHLAAHLGACHPMPRRLIAAAADGKVWPYADGTIEAGICKAALHRGLGVRTWRTVAHGLWVHPLWLIGRA
jgi:hypothetical protein